ncbi:MAG: protein phosphatase [Rhodobacteraceae bacterium PARR1]|nr:MAG: protein phosphatase [Rhodobacteraceae bacterium PARR1]
MTAVHGQQSIGQREMQEDSFDIIRQSEKDSTSDLLMLLADGMGGHAGGEVASNLTLQVFRTHFIEAARSSRPLDRLQESLLVANEAVRAAIQRDPDLRGMGCTFIGAIKTGNTLHWASVGDSALYLFRRGVLTRLNADHSVLGELMELVEKGKLTRGEALAHPRRNALRSAVTGTAIALIDARSIPLERDDVVMLATDGLDTLPTSEIAETLGRLHRSPREASAALLQAVDRRAMPSQDNTTVVIYRHSDGAASAYVDDSKWTMGRDGKRVWLAAVGLVCFVLLSVGLGYLLWAPAGTGTPDATSAALAPATEPVPELAPELAPAPTPGATATPPRRTVGIPDTSKPATDVPAEGSADTPAIETPESGPDSGPDSGPEIAPVPVPDTTADTPAEAPADDSAPRAFPTDAAVREALENDEAATDAATTESAVTDAPQGSTKIPAPAKD